MAIAFSRTMRSLDADDFRFPAIVWVLAVIVLAAWTWWFFAAQIPAEDAPAEASGAGHRQVERITPARLVWRAMGRSAEPPPPKDSSRQ